MDLEFSIFSKYLAISWNGTRQSRSYYGTLRYQEAVCSLLMMVMIKNVIVPSQTKIRPTVHYVVKK